jgi:protein disulfide-isomerase A1
MSKYFLLLAFVIATFAAVPQLTSENFFQELVTKDFLFVKFFSPKCGHCVAMASEYEKLYEQSAGKGYQVAEVDCSENR